MFQVKFKDQLKRNFELDPYLDYLIVLLATNYRFCRYSYFHFLPSIQIEPDNNPILRHLVTVVK